MFILVLAEKCVDLPVQIKNGACLVTGGIARYSCNSGYKLNGASERSCAADKTWSGSEPLCQRMSIKLIFCFSIFIFEHI